MQWFYFLTGNYNHLTEAMKLTDDALQEFEEIRQNAEKNHLLFIHVEEVCTNLGIEIKIQRYSRRQINRFNLKTNNAEEYYPIAFYIPFLDTYMLIT